MSNIYMQNLHLDHLKFFPIGFIIYFSKLVRFLTSKFLPNDLGALPNDNLYTSTNQTGKFIAIHFCLCRIKKRLIMHH